MDELIRTFHIDWRLILAQMINFGIVFVVLWFLALKPLMRILKQRQETVEKNFRDAKRVEETLARSRQMYEEKLAQGKEEAMKIVETAQRDAQERKKRTVAEAKQEVEKIVTEAKMQMKKEQEAVVEASREELADLLVQGLEKVMAKGLKPDIDKKFIERTLETL